jgi:stearoyl-CoA desaturase (delta-9 desaturase)
LSASFAPERLAVPESVSPRWNRLYVLTIAVVHALALLAFVPYFFEWAFVAVAILGVHVFGQGIKIGYHRLLTHRSFKAPRRVERAWAVLGICCLQDTPVRWVATHRMHHVHSDDRPDPHTPKAGFLWSHFGWLAYENSATQSIGGIEKFAKDLLRDPFYRWLEKNRYGQFLIVLAQFAIFFAVGAAIGAFVGGPWKALQLGSGLVVWGVIVRTILVWHITWSVNSLSHLFGYRNYETGEDSRNNWFVALVTVGEGWNNNHH